MDACPVDEEPQLSAMEHETARVSEAWIPPLLAAGDVKTDVYQAWRWLTDISATRALDGLDDGFDEAGTAAGQIQTAANVLSEQAVMLKGEVDKFLEQIGSA